VEALARELRLDRTMARRGEIEPGISDLPANLESRGRAMRFHLFEEVVSERRLSGVILAHHADDVAETILMRLARGSLWWTLRGIEPAAQHGELLVLRPLLSVRRDRLREYLQSIHQAWREDATNVSVRFARNRARKILEANPTLMQPSLELAHACDELCDWIDGVAPTLPAFFAVGELADRPTVIARLCAMRWLLSQGCPPAECSTEVIDRLIEMCRDAATPSRRSFPGPIEVRRRGRIISVKAP
jgi:tRNA(Ile)-lysidine synthetase-like protein